MKTTTTILLLLFPALVFAATVTVKTDGICRVVDNNGSIEITCAHVVPPVKPPVVTPPPIVVPPPVANKCSARVKKLNVQEFYASAGDALNLRMRSGDELAMFFITGAASRTVQTIDIVEWAGAPSLKNVSLSRTPCDYTGTAVTGRLGMRPNIQFTVGVEVSRSIIRPDLKYYTLQPNTAYYINLRHKDVRDGSNTCPKGCGMNFKFFGTP